jgi:TatA/E family protein of Tat protein translocase
MAGLIGWPELILILVIVVFVFGASRLKGLAQAVGEGVKEYKKAMADTPQPLEKNSKDEAVQEAATKMGISVEGKTTSQILEEMNEKVK